MMKKVWIINFFAGNRESGWGERHFFLSKELKKLGCDVLIISSNRNHMFDKSVEMDGSFAFKKYEEIDFCWVKVPIYSATSILRFWSMWVFTWRLFFMPVDKREAPDGIVVSSMPMFPILPALFLKWRLKIKKVAFEVRDLWPLTPVYLGSVSRYNPMVILMNIVERIAYKRADIIFSLLPKADKYINPISGNPNKFIYLPNGISEEINTSEDLPFKLSEVIPPDRFIVGYVGSIGIANAMKYVIDAARLLQSESKIHFVILGEGYQKLELQKEAADLGNITFLSKVKKGVVSKVISVFDVCIISWNKSDLYKFGVSANKLFDYMMASKPIIIAGDIADNPVEQSSSGICTQPESGEAIASAINELSQLPKAKLEEFGKNGRKYLDDFHSYPKLAQRFLTAFNA